MKFTNEENLKKFLNDEPYYENKEDYCLGDSLESASNIVNQLMDDITGKRNASDRRDAVCGNG